MRNSIKSKFEIFRQKTYVVIYGTHTPMGRLFDVVLLALIFISVIMVMLETVDDIDSRYHEILVLLEWIITVFFTVEYIFRIISNRKPLQYIFSFYGIIDLISILPMYLSFFISGSKILSVVRALRLLRLFRILDLANFANQGNELKKAIQRSRTKITVFIYFVLVICVILGSLMYVIESDESGFTSIPRSIYWCIVTLTTVGYGDIAPATSLGQIVASLVMILGYGIIAVPTGIVTSEYTKVTNEMKKNILEKHQVNIRAKIVNCERCKHEIHQADANFCSNCGSSL